MAIWINHHLRKISREENIRHITVWKSKFSFSPSFGFSVTTFLHLVFWVPCFAWKYPVKLLLGLSILFCFCFRGGVLGVNFVIHRLKSCQIGTNERISIKYWVWGSYMAPTLAWSPIDPSIVTKKPKYVHAIYHYISIDWKFHAKQLY